MTRLPTGATYELGAHTFEKLNHELVVFAMHFMAKCSEIDLARTSAITRLVSTDYVLMAELLSELHSARKATLRLLARHGFTPPDHEMFEDLQDQLEEVENLRDALAHRIWAYSPEKPDDIVLVDHKHLHLSDAGHAAFFRALEFGVAYTQAGLFSKLPSIKLPAPVPTDNRHTRVVTHEHLERLVLKARSGYAGMLCLYMIASKDPKADDARERLSKLLQSKLDPSRTDNPESPPQSP